MSLRIVLGFIEAKVWPVLTFVGINTFESSSRGIVCLQFFIFVFGWLVLTELHHKNHILPFLSILKWHINLDILVLFCVIDDTWSTNLSHIAWSWLGKFYPLTGDIVECYSEPSYVTALS